MNKEERKEEYKNLDINGVRDMIKNSLNTSTFRVTLTNNGIKFATPMGEISFSNKSIEYYYEIFRTTIQKAKSYEMYIDEMENIIAEDDPSKLCKSLKDIINYINSSEIHREKYSVISQWLNDGSITKDDLAALYKAYGSCNVAGLSPQLIDKFKASIKRNLEYYNILFKIFDIFDRSMFEGEDVEESQE